MADERPPVERLLDLALYAPVGALVALHEDLPKHVRQGRQAVENRIQLARFIGQFAVQQGRKELIKRIEANRQAQRDAASAPADQPVEPAVGLAAVDVEAPSGDDAAPHAVPAATELPIAEYESLAAIHVVERLGSLHPDELELVRRFEAAHRSRRTILAKVAQLQGDT